MSKRNSKLYVQAWCGFFHETIAYLKGNSKIKEKFVKKILTQKIRKTCFLAPKLGVDLCMGSTYTRVNTVVIKPADKGGAMVILNAIDYVEEAKRQLDNEIHYKKIESDLTSEHEQLINQCIDTYKNNGELEEEIAKLLKPVK